MAKRSRNRKGRKWFDSAHASLCLLGSYLLLIGLFKPLEDKVKLKQKVLKYTPIQKLEMLFVSLLAGAKAVYQTGTTLRVDRALQVAFGLPGCADQSVIADTLDAATDQDVAALRQAIEASFEQHSQARALVNLLLLRIQVCRRRRDGHADAGDGDRAGGGHDPVLAQAPAIQSAIDGVAGTGGYGADVGGQCNRDGAAGIGRAGAQAHIEPSGLHRIAIG